MELKNLWNLRLFWQLSVLVKVVINLVKQTKEKCNFYLIIIPDLGLEISQNIRIKKKKFLKTQTEQQQKKKTQKTNLLGRG